MGFFDRFRRPRWQHEDSAIRAAAVREMGPEEQDVIAGMARTDSDVAVRRQALRRVTDTTVILEVAASDADEGLRQEAAAMVLSLVLEAKDADAARPLLAALIEPRQLATVAREARHASVRRSALTRIDDPRQLAAVARSASDAALRNEALGRISDESVLADLALRSEHKEIAVAAAERLQDPDRLREVATKARSKWAARRARARLDVIAPEAPPEPAAPAPPTPEELDRQARAQLCERAETLADTPPSSQEPLDKLRADWNALSGTPDSGMKARFEGAMAEARAEVVRLNPAPVVEAEPQAEAAAVVEEPVAAAEAEPSAPVDLEQRAARLEQIVTELEGEQGGDRKRVSELRREWDKLLAQGDVPEALQARAAVVVARVEARAAETRQQREQQAKENQEKLEALAARAEAAAAAEKLSLRDAERLLRSLKDTLASMGQLPSPTVREALSVRLTAARALLFPRVQELRETDEWKRWGNATAREELVKRMEALREVESAEQAASQMRELDAQWGSTREVPRGSETEALQQRWQGAREEVRVKVDAWLAERRKAEAESLEQKRALIEKAEALLAVRPWSKAADEMRALQAEWKTVGPVAQREQRALWERFRAAGNSLFEQQKAERDVRRTEWAENMTRKEGLVARMEALASRTDWDAAVAEAKKLQSEWKTVGAVRKSQSDAIWGRFRAGSDAFFERYRKRHSVDEERVTADREALIAEIEGLAPAGAEPSDDVPGRLSAAQQRWTALGPVAKEHRPLSERFARARDLLLERSPASFRGTELDVEANLARRERLCERVEALLETPEGEEPPPPADASPAALLATRWREALAANTMGAPNPVEARARARADELAAAQDAWDKVGPVPGEAGKAVAERFRQACRKALGEKAR